MSGMRSLIFLYWRITINLLAVQSSYTYSFYLTLFIVENASFPTINRKLSVFYEIKNHHGLYGRKYNVGIGRHGHHL